MIYKFVYRIPKFNLVYGIALMFFCCEGKILRKTATWPIKVVIFVMILTLGAEAHCTDRFLNLLSVLGYDKIETGVVSISTKTQTGYSFEVELVIIYKLKVFKIASPSVKLQTDLLKNCVGIIIR